MLQQAVALCPWILVPVLLLRWRVEMVVLALLLRWMVVTALRLLLRWMEGMVSLPLLWMVVMAPLAQLLRGMAVVDLLLLLPLRTVEVGAAQSKAQPPLHVTSLPAGVLACLYAPLGSHPQPRTCPEGPLLLCLPAAAAAAAAAPCFLHLLTQHQHHQHCPSWGLQGAA